MNFVLQEMTSWRPAEFLRRNKRDINNATPADMLLAVESWLIELIEHTRKGENGA